MINEFMSDEAVASADSADSAQTKTGNGREPVAGKSLHDPKQSAVCNALRA